MTGKKTQARSRKPYVSGKTSRGVSFTGGRKRANLSDGI